MQEFFYFAQGFAFAALSFFAIYLTTNFGVIATDAIRLSTIAMFPWYIKIVIGAVSDKFAIGKLGRRRPYIVIGSILGLIGWLYIGEVQTFNALFIVMMVLVTLSVVVVDVIFDAFGVDVAPPNRRSLWQGVGWGFRGLGGLLGAILFGLLSENVGWMVAFYLVGGISLVGCFLTVLVKEPTDETGKIIVLTIPFRELFRPFTNKLVWISSFFNILAGVAITATTVFNLYLSEELGYGMALIGYLAATFAIGQFVGALLAGILGHKFHFKSIFIFSTILYVVWILLFLTKEFFDFNTPFQFMIGVGITFGIINAIYETTAMRLAMEYSVSVSAGTLYSWYMSLQNIGQLAIGPLIMAAIIDLTGSYLFAIQLGTMFLIIQLPVALWAIKKVKLIYRVTLYEYNLSYPRHSADVRALD